MKKIIFFFLFNVGIITNSCHAVIPNIDGRDLFILVNIFADLLIPKNPQSDVLVYVPTHIPLIGNSKILTKQDFSRAVSTGFYNSGIILTHSRDQTPPLDISIYRYSFFNKERQRIYDTRNKVLSILKGTLIEGLLELTHRATINITEDTVKKRLAKEYSPKKTWIFSKLSHSLASFVVQSIYATARTLKDPSTNQWQHPTISMPSRAGLVFDIKPDTQKSVGIDVNLEFSS